MGNREDKFTTSELREWRAVQQLSLSKSGLKEVKATHERIKERLFGIIRLAIILCAASGAGAISGGLYARPCQAALCGFTLCALCCVIGLWPTKTITANISPETFDKVLNNAAAQPRDKAEGARIMANAFYQVSIANSRIAGKDRKWLKIALFFLIISIFAWIEVAFVFS